MFDRYLSSHRELGNGSAEPLQVALVLGGAKPASPFDPPAELFSQHSLDRHALIKNWGLHYRSIPDLPGVIVSPSLHWLDLLPTVKTDADAYDRLLGLLFGYPLPDIDNYLQTNGSAYTPLKYVSHGTFSADEVAFLPFTFYRAEESEAGYERAIRIGKKHYDRIHELAREWELPTLATMADNLYTSTIETYLPDTYPPEKLNEMLSYC